MLGDTIGCWVLNAENASRRSHKCVLNEDIRFIVIFSFIVSSETLHSIEACQLISWCICARGRWYSIVPVIKWDITRHPMAGINHFKWSTRTCTNQVYCLKTSRDSTECEMQPTNQNPCRKLCRIWNFIEHYGVPCNSYYTELWTETLWCSERFYVFFRHN